MDMGLARSILEFLLRHGVEDRLLKNIIRVMPFSDCDVRLKKAMLLRKINSQIAKGSVSEEILELLERIEELEHEEVVASEALKRAYCAVAVECVVRCLGEGEDKEWEYFSAVRRIWKGRVSKIEMAEKVGLISDELRAWKEEIQLPVWDSNDGERVRLKSIQIDALEAVRAYVEEAWSGMGPPSFEFAPCIEGDNIKWEFLGLSNPLHEQADEGAVDFPDSCGDSIVSNGKSEKRRGAKRKHAAVKQMGEATRSSRMKTGIKEIDMQMSRNNHGPLPSPEINEVQTALGTSPLEVQASVQDYIPDALKLSERMNDIAVTATMYQEPSVEGKNGVDSRLPTSCVEKGPDASPINDTVLDNQSPISTSSLEPKVVVEEPCSGTQQFSENILVTAAREDMNEELSVEGQNTEDSKLPSPCVGKSAEAGPMNEAVLENGQPSQTCCLELKAKPKFPLPGPSVEESAKAAPIIALDNQESTRANCSKLEVVVDDLSSDTFQLPENKTVSLVRESMGEEPSVKELIMVESRTVSHCVRKTTDSLRLSENTKSGTIGENRQQELSVETLDRVESRPQSPCVEKRVEATTASEAYLDGQQPTETSCLKQKAGMQDRLADALRFSGKADCGTCGENTNQETVEAGKNRSDLAAQSNCVRETTEATPREDACLLCRHCRNQRNMPKPSLMERNSTCHTFEWDDSIDASAEDLLKRGNIPHLPSPKKLVVSPLKKYEFKRVGRRKVRRWSAVEEDTLRAGVKKYDVGNWKLILNTYRDIFEGRTAVDLKDKWRNMMRHSAV